MTPKLFSIKGHTWAESIEESDGHRMKLTVYETAAFYSPDRYFLEYRGGDSLVRLRAESREDLIRQAADAALEERIILPEDFDLDDSIDGCEILLFGKVLRCP